MANQEDIERATGGSAIWNPWAQARLTVNQAPVADFSGAGAEIAGISFEGFIFPGEAKFGGTEFSQAVSFRNAKFHGDANFNNVQFQASACFDHARFRKFANFKLATFEKLFVGGAKFLGEADFVDASFNHSEFTGVKFKHALTRFTGATFAHVPDFRAATFATPPLFQRVNIPYALAPGANCWRRWMSCAAGDDDAARFRRLKELAADWRDHERELEFFANELRAKRFHETKGFGGIALNWAYDRLSNFGRSIWRPIIGLAVLTCLAWLLIMLTYSTICAATWGQVGAGLVLSLTDWALLLGADKWDTRIHAFETLCPNCMFGPGAALLAYVQSAASLILLFLLGLGLRNRFRIGST
jgi:hypothetical protein